tara:strand:- start:71 stop:370 length:300 start_codon:yes stop_codon:yes gene_type:complete
MKTLTKNNLSLYLLEDAEEVTLTDTNVVVGTRFIVDDCNSSDSVLHEGVATPPGDWVGHMYTYNGTAWALNPAYTPPEEPEVPEVLFDSDGNPIEPIPA